jgi:hypothetical protein
MFSGFGNSVNSGRTGGPGGFQRYIDQMFNTGSTANTTLTTMFPGVTSAAGSYSPKANGALLAIAVLVQPTAATSLCQSGYITLNCTLWAPVNTLTIGYGGYGLATAPQVYGGAQEYNVYNDINLPVNTAVPINGQNIENFSPVTPSILVMGLFSAKLSTAAPT